MVVSGYGREAGIEHGGKDLFEQLYRDWRPGVHALCRRLLRDSGDVEDATQEVFLRVWMGWHSYSPDRPFWPWVAIIARRVCLNQLEQLAREPVNTGDPTVDVAASVVAFPPDRVVEADDELRFVVRLVGQLRPAERSALTRRHVDGWSYRRIARVEGVTVESVRGSLKRARSSLRKSLAAVLSDDLPSSTWTPESRMERAIR